MLAGRMRGPSAVGLKATADTPTNKRHVQDRPLLDLPDRLVQILQVRGQLQVLHAAIVRDQLHADVLRPQATLDEIPEQVAVHLDKLA